MATLHAHPAAPAQAPPMQAAKVDSLPAADPHVQRPPRSKQSAECWVEVLTSPAELNAIRPRWEELVGRAIEPNPFYEPWMLLPSLRAFGEGREFRFLLVYQEGLKPKDPPRLCGFAPMEITRGYGGMPVRVLKLFSHQYEFLATPLVDRDAGEQVLKAIWRWAAQPDSGVHVVEFSHVHGDGPFQRALIDALYDVSPLWETVQVYNRALLRRTTSAEEFLAASMTPHNRQEVRRQRRRLGEQGALEVRVIQPADDADHWIDQFLCLESAGWKGQESTALASVPADAEWFREVARAAHGREQLFMLGLFLDGKPLAMKCNFIGGTGGFAFKIAFDETYAKFSPGVQLEVENILQVHQHPRLEWMDSCALPGHFMISRLWPERRTIQKILLSTGKRLGNLTVASIPLARAARRMFRPNSVAASAGESSA